MTEPATLAPCPGCGQTDHARVRAVVPSPGLVAASCDCGWSAPHAHTDEEARAQWNRRAPALRWRTEQPDVDETEIGG